MSKSKKIILLVVSIALLLIIGLGVGGYIWVRENKDRLVQQGQEAHSEGERFGVTATQEECVNEAVARLKAHPGLIKEVNHKFFLMACIEVAKQTPGFCNDVPPVEEIIKGSAYTLRKCKALGLPVDQSCFRLLQGVQLVCHGE